MCHLLSVQWTQIYCIGLNKSNCKQIYLIIECLKFSPLAQALTMVECVPLVNLSKAYSSAIYSKAEDIIHFKVASHKASITKPHFSRLLGLTSSKALVDP